MGPLFDNLAASLPAGPAPEVGQELQQLRADVDALAGALDTLADLVQGVDGHGGGQVEEAGPSKRAWRYAEPAAADELWESLRDFVDWLNSRYALDSERQVPPCWYRHPVAVEELTALMSSWQNAYHGPDLPGDAPLAWHAHSLWPCLDRLPDRAGWQRCRGAGHVERASLVRPTDDLFAQYTAGQRTAAVGSATPSA